MPFLFCKRLIIRFFLRLMYWTWITKTAEIAFLNRNRRAGANHVPVFSSRHKKWICLEQIKFFGVYPFKGEVKLFVLVLQCIVINTPTAIASCPIGCDKASSCALRDCFFIEYGYRRIYYVWKKRNAQGCVR